MSIPTLSPHWAPLFIALFFLALAPNLSVLTVTTRAATSGARQGILATLVIVGSGHSQSRRSGACKKHGNENCTHGSCLSLIAANRAPFQMSRRLTVSCPSVQHFQPLRRPLKAKRSARRAQLRGGFASKHRSGRCWARPRSLCHRGLGWPEAMRQWP